MKYPSLKELREQIRNTPQNPPYAKCPTVREFAEATRTEIAVGDALGELAELLDRWDKYQAYEARTSALRTVLHSHYKSGPDHTVIACKCAKCVTIRDELATMYANKQTATGAL